MSVWSSIMDFLSVENPEAQELARLVAIVDRQIATTWPAIGDALAEIRERQLYRITHKTWAAFLQERWEMSESHASRMIAASTLHTKALTAGKTPPATPRLARPIASLPDEDQLPAWSDAVDLAAGEEVRPEHVETAVARRRPAKAKKDKKAPKPIRLRLPGGTIIIEPNKAFTTAEDLLQHALKAVRQRAAA